MRFGINFFPSFRPEDSTTAAYFQQCLRLAERADALGYHSIKTVEHSFYDYGGHSPNPCVFLSAVAARTRRVRLITGAVIPAFHHPAHLGGDLAMLDNMSNGRLDAGFGRAFLPKEFEVYGVPMSESRERFEEAIGMIRRMWTEERVNIRGKHWNLEDVRLMPRVVQKPHPPVWIAAISTEESFLYAAKNGFNLMIVPYAGKPGQLQEFVKTYRRVWVESGHEPGAEQIQVAQFCYVAEKREEAQAGFERICRKYLQTFADAVVSWQGKSSDQYPGYDKMVASILATTPEKIVQQGGAFVGTPEDVVAQLKACVDTFGVIEPSMQINFGGTRDEEAFRTLELFATGVMPEFRKLA
ncbi:MAG TPA: LLM class flavin-dependent oxidoreductase [Burkholderiales bacterium]|nr:LLM class flavin-dependent oxidoreductase [Burkholderiales bacterium]